MSGTAYYVCPRCGRPIDWVERRVKNGHVYYYACHVITDENGQKRRKKCYLGPERYVYTNRVLATAGFQVKSLAQQLMEDKPLIVSQLEDLVKAIEEKMAKTEMSANTAQQLADRLQGLVDRLRKYAVERAEEEAKAKGEEP